MVRILWGIVKPVLVQWLTSRALVIPTDRATEISKKLGVPVEVVMTIDAEILASLPALLDKFKP